MKKILIAMVMMVGMLSFTHNAGAQTATPIPVIAGDTVSTSGSLDTVTKIISVTAGYSALGIQVTGTKTSGTITSKAYLYGSLDGVTYNLTDSSTAFADAAGAQARWFTKATAPYVYYKVQVRPPTADGTTEGLAVKMHYVLRRHD